MATNTPLYLAVHAVMLALLCTRLDAQNAQVTCSGGQVRDDTTNACVTLGASLMTQGIQANTNVKLTVYSAPVVGAPVPTVTVMIATVTDQLLLSAIFPGNRYMVYVRLAASAQDSPPIAFASTSDSVSTTRDFWNNAAMYMSFAQGSGAMKTRVTAKANQFVTISLMFRPYDENCYTAPTAPSTCTWMSLDSTNNDLSYGQYEFYVVSGMLLIVFPRVVNIGSPASLNSKPTCSEIPGQGQICMCSATGFAAFNSSLCVPIGRVLREKGFKTDRNINLTFFQSTIDPAAGQLSQPPRRVFQKTIRITDDLILDELTPLSYNSLIDYDNQNVYCTIPQIEDQVQNAIINQNTVATLSATANGAGLYTVTRALLWSLFNMEYRAYSTACQGANATGDCQWLSFPSTSMDLAAGTYELLAQISGLYAFPPLMYTVGASSGAPATAVLPSIFSLVCLVVLAAGLRLD